MIGESLLVFWLSPICFFAYKLILIILRMLIIHNSKFEKDSFLF